MAGDAQQLLNEYVMNVVEDMEATDDPDADVFDPLEVYVECSYSDKSLREIYLVLTTGGPHIELALFAGRLDGYWASKRHHVPVNSGALDVLADRYERGWTA